MVLIPTYTVQAVRIRRSTISSWKPLQFEQADEIYDFINSDIFHNIVFFVSIRFDNHFHAHLNDFPAPERLWKNRKWSAHGRNLTNGTWRMACACDVARTQTKLFPNSPDRRNEIWNIRRLLLFTRENEMYTSCRLSNPKSFLFVG